jgi:hypothetical protein
VSKANQVQIGGDHYKNGGEEHWDRVHRLGLDYFQAAITKYVERWKLKNGVEDLNKARHFLDKYIELHTEETPGEPLDLTNAEAAASSLQKSGVRVIHLGAPKTIALDTPLAYPPLANTEGYRLGEVMPTGWTQFVFEGAPQEGYLFTCRECGKKFYTPPDMNPHGYHACRALADDAGAVHEATEASRAYVNQD